MSYMNKEVYLKKKEQECNILKVKLKEKEEEIVTLSSKLEMFESQFQALPKLLQVLMTSNENVEDFVSVRNESDTGYHSGSPSRFTTILKTVRKNMEKNVKKDRLIIKEQLEKISDLENELATLRQIVPQFSLKLKALSEKNKEITRLLQGKKSTPTIYHKENRGYHSASKIYSAPGLDRMDSVSTPSVINTSLSNHLDSVSIKSKLPPTSPDLQHYKNTGNASKDVTINSNTSLVDLSISNRSKRLFCPICEKTNWKSLSELQEHCLTCGSLEKEDETEICIICSEHVPRNEINEHTNSHFEEEEHLDFYFE